MEYFTAARKTYSDPVDRRRYGHDLVPRRYSRHPSRAFHPAALSAHDSAFAKTVHKGPGLGVYEVWLLFSARDNCVLSREPVIWFGMEIG